MTTPTHRWLVSLTLLACTAAWAADQAGPGATMTPTTVEKIKADLLARHGEGQRARVNRGVDQVAALWRTEDGDLASFCSEHFLSDDAALEQTLARLEYTLEQLDGHMNEILRELRRPTDLDTGPMLAVDPLLAALDPSAHVVEDLFRSNVAFVALLNFPLTTVRERVAAASSYSRRQWAEVRLAGRFAQRVPPDVKQEIARAAADAELYISEYNVWAHHLVDAKGQRLFPPGKRLITHWNIRDEIKASYADKGGLERQRTLARVMDRIVTQTIPAEVINNPRKDWDPVTNRVGPAPAATVEENAPAVRADVSGAEPDTRYARLLAQFHALKRADPYVPTAPTFMARSYELGREMEEARVVGLLRQVLESPVVGKVAKEVERRLKRKLEPHDIWFPGFKPRPPLTEPELDAITRQRYPTAAAFAQDIPRILAALGFSPERARYLADRIVVDSSRGAGHALQSNRRGDFPHLRTRVEKDGMNYKGYNIAIHELGHNVEQVFSLYNVDHTLLQGVPNNAFTEAMAFIFQARDLELLGVSQPDAKMENDRVLNDFWATWEIAGVALVDNAVWHWMYDHPDATPAQLKEAVLRISREHWSKHYAPVLGGKDTTLLGIYSHMISYPLYLADYPLGHLVAFQVEEHLKQGKVLGVEVERMTSHGAVTPDAWMVHATGAPVSADPLLKATARALGGKGR